MLYSYAMNRILYICFLLSVICLFSSCKKDKDELSPIIIVESPHENQEFDVFDFINVKAKITDETNLVSI